jgi:hypothetical protein
MTLFSISFAIECLTRWSAKMFICKGSNDYNNIYGNGDTLLDAYKDYKACEGEDDADDCIFYEAQRLDIEVCIQKKEVVKSICRKP